MKIEEIRAEAKKYHTGWGDDRDNAPVQAFELGAKWAYNRALKDAVEQCRKEIKKGVAPVYALESILKLKL